MPFLVPPRHPTHELLDDQNLPFEEMIRSLTDIDRVNRKWGASHALERHLLSRISDSSGKDLLLLDVGAGSGALAGRLEDVLSRDGSRVHVIALDLQWRHLRAGRAGANGSAAVAGDAFRLPLGDAAVDWIVSTLLFHHFSPQQNVLLLREFARVARSGFALLDLRRHLLPLLFVSVAGPLLFQSRASVADGPASVRQAYTQAEAERIAREAWPGTKVERVFPFRLLITGPGAVAS
jgi:ubiquinone/menaquinone biosynthesis C-methylase UbiE